MACRLASPRPGEWACHLGLTHTWCLRSPHGPLGPGESGPYLVLSQTRGLWSPPGPHLDLVNVVSKWASTCPGDFVPHLDLIAVDSILASSGTGDSDPICALPRSGDSGPHLGITGTCLLCSTLEPHLDMTTLEPPWGQPDTVTLVPIWKSPRPGESCTPLGDNLTW